MNIRRFRQVLGFAIKDSLKLKKLNEEGRLYRWTIFHDMIRSFLNYNMWTNQYMEEEFYSKTSEEKARIGSVYKQKGAVRDKWQKEFIADREFFIKFSHKKYERPNLRQKRNNAYRKKYNMGIGCLVEYDVEISRQHYLPGTIKIGNNVLLAKHVFIDYSGFIEIKDGVKIAAGVKIESHHRDLEEYEKGLDVNIPTKLVIEENAYVGVNAIILDSCNYIGKYARVWSCKLN